MVRPPYESMSLIVSGAVFHRSIQPLRNSHIFAPVKQEQKHIYGIKLRGRSYIAILFVVVVITIVVTYILNRLISDEVEDVSANISRSSFVKKYDNLQNRFLLLQKPLYDAENLALESSDTVTSLQRLRILSAIQISDSSVVRNWYGIVPEGGEQTVFVHGAEGNTTSLRENIRSQLQKGKTGITGKVLPGVAGQYLWRQTIYFKAPYGTVFYGYDLDLGVVHQLLLEVGKYTQSYAYIFTADGVCLLHPDTVHIGKNVFDFSAVLPSDTISGPSDHNERVVASKYLDLEVMNYVKPLHIAGGRYYIAVNFLKSINEEDINRISKYSLYIYLLSTLLLLFIFYYFTRAIRIQYRRQEQLRQEKAGLALEKEVFQKESALLQLQQLKNQVDPHFLFNALNALHTLIDQDKALSKKFTVKLSRLYRYLIQAPEENITRVEKELNFIAEYLFLQQTRFADKIECTTTVKEVASLQRKIPYLSLQTLVENALKHNVATREHPLYIGIIVFPDKVVVKNTYQPKEYEQEGSRFGLKYLKRIYGFYKVTGFKTGIKDGFFYCELPLM